MPKSSSRSPATRRSSFKRCSFGIGRRTGGPRRIASRPATRPRRCVDRRPRRGALASDRLLHCAATRSTASRGDERSCISTHESRFAAIVTRANLLPLEGVREDLAAAHPALLDSIQADAARAELAAAARTSASIPVVADREFALVGARIVDGTTRAPIDDGACSCAMDASPLLVRAQSVTIPAASARSTRAARRSFPDCGTCTRTSRSPSGDRHTSASVSRRRATWAARNVFSSRSATPFARTRARPATAARRSGRRKRT